MNHVLAKLAIAMSLLALGLGLSSCGGEEVGSIRIVVEPEEGAIVEDLDQALDDAAAVIERRIEAFEFGGGDVSRTGDRIVVQLSGDVSLDEITDKLGRPGLLEFCEPVRDAEGNVAVVDGGGRVKYKAQSCEPERDGHGNIVVEGGSVKFVPWGAAGTVQVASNPPSNVIVWQLAKAEVDGVEKALTGEYLRPNTFVTSHPVLERPILVLEWTGEGADISEQVTERLVERNYPLAVFLDGRPLLDESGSPIAPLVQGVVATQAQISGLASEDADELSKLLNAGRYPLKLRIVETQQE